MDQVSDVGVPQLVQCDHRIQAVNDILPIHALLSGFRLELLLDSLTVHVFIESNPPFHDGSAESAEMKKARLPFKTVTGLCMEGFFWKEKDARQEELTAERLRIG